MTNNNLRNQLIQNSQLNQLEANQSLQAQTSTSSLSQDHSYQSQIPFILPGPTSLLAGALPTPFHHLNRNRTSSDSLQLQFNRLSELDPHQFQITARHFSNEIRDIQHITNQVIRDSNQAYNLINNNNSTTSQITPQFISDSILFDSEPIEDLRRFREQMDRVSEQATSIHVDNGSTNEADPGSIEPSETSITFPELNGRIGHLSPLMPYSPPLPPPPLQSNLPARMDTTDSFDLPFPQNRTHEFLDHSARMRLNRRPRLSPVPSSSSDHDISESLESFRRCSERLKRFLSSAKLDLNDLSSNPRTDPETRQPTTAELAEAAARASNEHHALPAFYSPDQSLKITKVIIPVDTNPMERRKIIFEASKDGSIRWKDSNQKATYERSKDGLVGEEIGEIEFNYICLPKKKKQSSKSLPTLGLGPTRSIQSSSFSRQRAPNQATTDRAIGEASERINEARTRSMRDHQSHHTNRYQLYQRPRYRLVAASRRHIPLNRDITLDQHNQHRNSSTIHGELNRSSSRPTTQESFSSNHNHNNPSSRLTRRPISWPGRFFSAPSDHYRFTSSNHYRTDQERDRNEESEQEDMSINDDYDWDHPTPPFVQSPPFDESISFHPLVHF